MNPGDLSTPFWRRFTDEGKRSLKETRALYDAVEKQYQSSPWSKPDAINRVSTEAVRIIKEDTSFPDYEPLREAFRTCFERILALEEQIFSSIEVNFSQPLTLREQMTLNDWLRERSFFLEHDSEIADLLLAAFRSTTQALLDALPAVKISHLSVPLFSVLRHPAALMESILSTCQKPDHTQHGIFTALSATLKNNICGVSGVSPDAPTKKPHIYPTTANMKPNELVDSYFRGTPFHELFLTPVPFELPAEQRYAGHWLIAPPGRGKTTCLHAMLADDLRGDAAIILMDSKGDLIEPFRQMKAIADRLIIIDPDPERPIAINPLDIPRTEIGKAIELLEYLFASLLEFELTPSQSLLFRNVIRLLVTQFRHPTLELFREILGPRGWNPKYAGPVGRLEPRLREFFHQDFDDDNYVARRREVLNRLRLLLDNDTMNAMLSAPITRFTFDEALDAGKIVIINNSKERLGEQGAEFFGRFFIAQLLATAQRRSSLPQHLKRQVFCYIDECQNVIARDQKISTILDECRSQKIAMILSHQRTAQITNENVLSALRNCAIRFANSDAEARVLSNSLRTSQQFLETLGRGQFAAYVRDLTKNAIAIGVVKPDCFSEERLTGAEQQRLKDRMMRDYGRLPVPTPEERPRKPEQRTTDTSDDSERNDIPERQAPGKPDSSSEW